MYETTTTDSAAMKAEHDYGAHHGDEFGGQWVHVADDQSPHQSPLHEFNGFYMSPPSHMEIESSYFRTTATSHTSNPPLYPLIVPQWPSQLTNPSVNPPSSQPQSCPSAPALAPRPIAPSTSTKSVEAPSTTQSAPFAPAPIPTPSSGRRTLTDQDRRRMCQYHEENPTVKQTEIGSIFGVERSTVSKVLRHKDKYLHPDDGSRSPIKRAKGKFPDIERAVSVWAKNHQRQGLPLSNDLIRDKARVFATTVGSSDCVAKVNSPIWLEKFKQRNGLLGASLPESEAEDSDMGQPLDTGSGSQTPHGISPISPAEQHPGSPDPDRAKNESSNGFADFHPTFRRAHSQTEHSVGSYFTDANMPSTFSPDLRSPTSPFFSPASSCGPSPSVPSQTPHLPTLAPADSRPRRQTFPAISSTPSYITPPTSATAEPMSSTKLFQQPIAAPSTLESPLEEIKEPTLSIDSAMHNAHPPSASNTPVSTNNISPSSMAPPPHPPSASPRINGNNAASGYPSPKNPPPPSQDEARRALDVVMQFLKAQPASGMDPQDYITMGKLMEKLKLRGDELPGGMRSMMTEREGRGDGTLPVGRKRSIHSLS
ncbi:MAG: hypothetical protein LQ338_005498 [Usnochroma carphineum]|nr:MAG: hypothetical protein LQ338_005498 [Usnochroma carphineum]